MASHVVPHEEEEQMIQTMRWPGLALMALLIALPVGAKEKTDELKSSHHSAEELCAYQGAPEKQDLQILRQAVQGRKDSD